jgi:hypothetical protein
MKKILVSFIALALVFSFGCAKKDASTVNAKLLKATVSLVIGEVVILRDNAAGQMAAKMNMELQPADMVITGDKSKLNIVLENSGVVQIGPNSKVVLSALFLRDDGSSDQKIAVKAGQIILGLKKLQKDSAFNVETPTAVAGVRGTSFMVNVQENEDNNAFPFFVKLNDKKNVTTKIAVLAGAVELSGGKSGSKTVMVNQLKQAVLQGADFDNVQVMNIDRLTLDQLSEIRGFAEISKLKMQDIAEEIGQVDPEIKQMLKTDLTTTSEIKKATSDVSAQEKKLQDSVTSKEQEIEKVKVKQKREGKYVQDQGSW